MTAQSLTRLPAARAVHTRKDGMPWPLSPEPKTHPNTAHKPDIDENIGRKRFGDFNVAGKVFIVTGGAQGLGLTMAEGLVEAGGKGNASPATHDNKALLSFY
jgi:hypothetical protein